TRRHQANVGGRKIEMLERFDLQGPVAERDFHALASAGGKRDHFVGGKLALGQDIEHLAAHIAGRADDGDALTHHQLSIEIWLRTAGAEAGTQRLLRENSHKYNAGGVS